MRLFKLLWVISFFATGVFGQASEKRQEYVHVPRGIVLSVIAVQPNCPIAFEDVGHFTGINGGSFNNYTLRNVGNKPIRAFKVATSSGAEMEIPRESGLIISPGELVPESGSERDKIIPLTNVISDRLKLTGPMRGMVILMIVSVEFTDGTSFHDETAYHAMRTFADKIDDALREQEEIRKTKSDKQKKF